MAEGTLTIPDYVTRLSDSLARALPQCDIDYEKVRSDRYRFVVVWPGFEGLEHPERQRLVWEVADVAIDKADLMRVLMIVTLAPSEVPQD